MTKEQVNSFITNKQQITKCHSDINILNMNEFQNKTKTDSWHTYYAPLLADLFLYSYEAEFIQGRLKKNKNKSALAFNFTFRYIDNVLPLNNSRFGDFIDRIYPIELEIKDTTDTDRLAFIH